MFRASGYEDDNILVHAFADEELNMIQEEPQKEIPPAQPCSLSKELVIDTGGQLFNKDNMLSEAPQLRPISPTIYIS